MTNDAPTDYVTMPGETLYDVMPRGRPSRIIRSAAPVDLILQVSETEQGSTNGDQRHRPDDSNPSAVRRVEGIPVTERSGNLSESVFDSNPAYASHGSSRTGGVLAHAAASDLSRRSVVVDRNLDNGDGGYMDVEGTASPLDRLESDVSLMTDTGLDLRQ